MRTLLIILALIIGSSILSNLASPPTGPPKASQTSAPRCNVEGARALVGKLQGSGVFYKIDQSSSIPKIYVGEIWNSLMIDEKTTFDGVLQCWLGNGQASVLIVYRDARTGQEVASSSRFGFEMK